MKHDHSIKPRPSDALSNTRLHVVIGHIARERLALGVVAAEVEPLWQLGLLEASQMHSN